MAAKKAKQNKQLVLLRHAKSSWDDPLLEDFDRPLAKRGREAAKRVAEWFKDRQVRPDLVLSSPSARTRETLNLIRGSLGPSPTIVYEKRIYLAKMDDLLDRIRKASDDVGTLLVIGHNPGLQELALALMPASAKAGRKKLADKFPTAALARFDMTAVSWMAVAPGAAKLVEFVRPTDLDD